MARRTAGWLLACAGAVSSPAWAQVVNGDFEAGGFGPWTSNVSADSGTTVTGSVSGPSGAVAPHAGSNFAWGYDNLGTGSLTQPVSTTPGGVYAVSVWVSSSGGVPPNTASIRLGSASPAVTCTVVPAVWTQCSGTFTAAGSSETLALLFSTQGGTGVLAFDDVAVSLAAAPGGPAAVPTLAEWGLLWLAVMAGVLAAWSLRRRRQPTSAR